MLALQSSNPVLANEQLGTILGETRTASDTATVMGVVNKTSLLIGAAVIAGSAAYALVETQGAVFGVVAASGLITLVLFFTLLRRVNVSPVAAFAYAIAQGAALGSISKGLEWILISQGLGVAAGSLALQAFVVTTGVTLATLGLYRARILRPTKRFNAILTAVVGGIAVTYLIGFVLMFFNIQLPFLSIGSALQGGTAALIGLGLNAVILIIAALTLVMDFGQIEEAVTSGAPRKIEWYLAFGLTVSLAWIYYEALKMVFRVAMLLGDRK